MSMSLREFILNNFTWKLASVAMAILIWITINSNTQDSFTWIEIHGSNDAVSRRLPVTVITTASDMRGFVITPSHVEVTLRGKPAVLNNLNLSDVQVFVNLTDVKDLKSFRRKVIAHTPPNVLVVKLDPEEVAVERVSPPESAQSHNPQP